MVTNLISHINNRLKMYNKKSLIKLFLIIAGFGMLMYVHYQFSISFAVLACVFLAAITFIPFFYHRKRENNAMNLNYGVENYNYALISAICLLVLGFCSVYTLNNYFYADKHVYRNIDHHVFRLEGISIANPNNFILAENSRNAFFDSDRNCGRILINQVSDSSVCLTSEGFSRVVFKDSTDSDGRRLKREVINKESLIRFRQNDTVQFRMNNNQVYTLAVDVVNKDSVNYHITLPDGQSIIADEHRFIIHGISLMELMRNPSVVNADFKGIHLVREKVYPLVKQHDKLEWYKDVPFCLEIQNSQHAAEDFYVTDIKVGNGNWTGIHQNIVDTINIPLGTPFTIGYGKNESQTCYFSKRREGAGSGISLLYKLPLYRNFSYKKDNDFNQICVTTSVAEYKRDARFVPENIILYDIFYHDENINNMQPITVSYVSGPTTQNLEFDYTAGNSTGHRKANPGESFEAISTRGGNHSVTWIAGVENLKDSSPFQPSAINWSILLFAFCLAVLLFVGAHQHGTAYDETREYTVLNRIGRNSFTTIEFIAYAVTLYLVAFRWFLLWRVSVFIPVEQINYFEFNGVFRNHSNGTYLTLGMFAFVGLIVLVKLWICYHPNWICGLFDTLKRFLNKSNKLKRLFNKINNLIKLSWFWWIPVVIFTIIAFVVCNFQRHSGRASILILFPVLTYLFNSFAIAKMYGGKWYGRKEQNDNRNRRKALKVLFWSLVNALAFSGLLLYVDSGYGIIFLTFSLFWMIWMLHEFVTQIIPDQDYTIWRLLTVLMLFVFVLLLFFIYKDIIKFIYDQPFWISTVLITIAGCVLGIILSYILAVKSAKNVRSWILSF